MLRELSLTFLNDVTVKHGDKMEKLKDILSEKNGYIFKYKRRIPKRHKCNKKNDKK